jgi:hypothetical protein
LKRIGARRYSGGVADEVDRLRELVGDAQKLIEATRGAQEAFRVGDVAAARETLSGLANLLAQIAHEVGTLLDGLPTPPLNSSP